MWWTRDNSEENSTKPRCPACFTHPVLVQSGYGDEKSLRCPVCKCLFNSNGVKYDPDAKKNVDQSSTTEEVLEEQQALWESLWGK